MNKSFLNNAQADILICGGIGGGAQNALAQAGIKLFGGVMGNADEAVKAYLNGTLNYNANVQCNHHGHGHSCGGHGHACHEDKHGCSGNLYYIFHQLIYIYNYIAYISLNYVYFPLSTILLYNNYHLNAFQ